MQYVVFNGSPRRKASNSGILVEKFLQGFAEAQSETWDIHYLADVKRNDEHVRAFSSADHVLIIFPLYTDSMPGIVKYFFETLIHHTYSAEKTLGFIVQSGFPESKHSLFVSRYLEKFAKRLGCTYLGTIMKGGVEGIQVRPPAMNKKLFKRFYDLGSYYARHHAFEPLIAGKLRKPFRLNRFRRIMLMMFDRMGLVNFYWNMKLKQHKAYPERFAMPYK